MGNYRQGQRSWTDSRFYPVEKELVEDFEDFEDYGEAVLLTDTEGELGHDLQDVSTFMLYIYDDMITKRPGIVSQKPPSSRAVLQDIFLLVFDGTEQLYARIERRKHDSHTKQPLKGANCASSSV